MVEFKVKRSEKKQNHAMEKRKIEKIHLKMNSIKFCLKCTKT